MLPAVECHIGGILQALIVLIAEIGGDPAKYIENTLVAIQLKEFEHISGDPAKKNIGCDPFKYKGNWWRSF